MATHFKGPVVSDNGFTGAITATTITASTSATIGSAGSAIKAIKTGTVAVDPGSVLDGDVVEATATITGVAAGDIVILVPPAAGITAALAACEARVSAADTVKVRIINGSGSTVDEASASWTYLWFDLT